ncbi:F-BAR and double SH3 domains protein 2 [Latimeria chalumnae]|uniref:F-BAR and double SH3 domains protein 2 n=1 Tax=Latimeria chalumnae TaxID=7897 RepID=UPI00313D0965
MCTCIKFYFLKLFSIFFFKVKATQEVKVCFSEQLSKLQSKQHQECEVLEEIRSFSKQRATIERDYGQALQRLASQFQKKEWHRGKAEGEGSSTIFAVWRAAVEGTVLIGQARVAASENYRTLSVETAKIARASKEQRLKKSSEQLVQIQLEVVEAVKELEKVKKKYVQLQRIAEIAGEKAADAEAKVKKNESGIFQSKTSLQKMSAKLTARLGECSLQLAEARNEYLLTMTAINAHHQRYYQMDLPVIMKNLDGDLYDRLRDHFLVICETEIHTCQSALDQFQRILQASRKVSREENLQLFLQENPVFTRIPICQFQPAGSDKIRQLERQHSDRGGESGLEKEARRLASKAAKDYKIQAHGERVLQSLEKRRKTVLEEESSSLEQKMEEVRENIRKAEIAKVKADARLEFLRQAGVNVDSWISSAMAQANEELEKERKLSEARMSNGAVSMVDEFEFTELEDFDDIFEDSVSGSREKVRLYPMRCRVLYSYQASQADELTISQDEKLEVLEDGDMEEWVKAQNKAGQVGYVPEKYLEFLGHSSQRVAMAISSDNVSNASGNSVGQEVFRSSCHFHMLDSTVQLVRALYDYEGQSADELSFQEGAIIQLLQKDEDGVDDGFWRGEFNRRVGVFPSLVVEELTRGGSETELVVF